MPRSEPLRAVRRHGPSYTYAAVIVVLEPIIAGSAHSRLLGEIPSGWFR